MLLYSSGKRFEMGFKKQYSDEFYIQFFQAAFPEIDFSQLTAG
jgi:hypothetical protein